MAEIEHVQASPVGQQPLNKNVKNAPNKEEGKHLFNYGQTTIRNEAHFLHFQLLHRLNLANLQNKLAKCKTAIVDNSDASEEAMFIVRKLLKHYATAMRDLQYMQSLEHIPDEESDRRRRELIRFFPDIDAGAYDTIYHRFPRTYPSSSDKLDWVRTTLRDKLTNRLSYSREERNNRFDEYLDGKPPEGISTFVDTLARFIIGFTGGASLLVPMLVMVFKPSLVKSIVTVSIAVTLFAVLCSIGIKTSNSETLAATAGYAAVLVVFIGTSGTASS